MASVGTYTVQIWRGRLKGPRRRIRTHERQGISGTGIIRGAYFCPISTIFTIETVASESVARQREAEYEALEGTETKVVDDSGVTHETAMIFGVQPNAEPRAKIVGGAGANDTWEVQATWQIILPFSAVKKGGVTQ